MDNSFLWLLFFIISLLLEVIASPGLFFFLAFSLGALGAAYAAWIGYAFGYQAIAFLGLSAISFLLLNRFMKTISRDTLHKSNVYALQGKKGMVTETISGCKKGWIKVEGEIWSAASIDDSAIEKGEMAEVISSSGSHLKVKKIKSSC